ncbi:Alpha/beta hydrolase family protein [Celeribacter baekdonensis]|uniref:Alpha/beta hydrolase family protein n=1 Tax=Celeribacter baekdonensis TaxID=875171 RepID=A0A1G7NYJ4_9RHOB|nr:prolyl oligopeptidase family serine peptidase [Celeribacter baekdonensis]SDF78270.1 Alpha/beta hydrolase family protein [Celeribacter baekdonensis]
MNLIAAASARVCECNDLHPSEKLLEHRIPLAKIQGRSRHEQPVRAPNSIASTKARINLGYSKMNESNINPTLPVLQEIVAKPPVALSYLPGQSGTLVICLAGVGTKRSQSPPREFHKMASQEGANHVLFVSDASRSWMNGSGIAQQIVAAIEKLADQVNATRIVALGNSMGGTMALMLAGLTQIDAAIAIVPQFSVHPERVPEEQRWRAFRNQITDWPFETITRLHSEKTSIMIIHGVSPDERIHLDRFPKDAKAMHFVFPDMDHRLAFRLHKKRKLNRIIRHAIAARPWKLRRAIGQAGGLPRELFERTQRQDQQ